MGKKVGKSNFEEEDLPDWLLALPGEVKGNIGSVPGLGDIETLQENEGYDLEFLKQLLQQLSTEGHIIIETSIEEAAARLAELL